MNNFAMMSLLSEYLNNFAFKKLRTEKQLGYIVAASFKPVGCIDGAGILV
jgi:insulysin